uniref:Ribosomal protein S7 n=1 Tax=Psammoneis japonica TaxID=517775 RepID=A0A2U9GIS0_9STRA|nr:ribosomal protein S7 [Psammoneis japonica]AWQ64260.1 ribosomal protein S7 [Psammoneis japonica]
MKKSRHNNALLKNKIYNYLLRNGHKKTCEKILLKSIKLIQKFSDKNEKDLIKQTIVNNAPILQVKQIKRKRKKLKEFPFIITRKIRIFFAIKLILETSKQKLSRNFANKLKQEILLSANSSGEGIKEKKAIQEHALKLKKYAHYRWT